MSSKRIAAHNALLVIKQGDQIKPIARAHSQSPPDRIMLGVAQRALIDKRVLKRVPAKASATEQDAQQIAYVGLSMRVAGRPGAAVFCLQVATSESDTALLQRVAQQTLRRAEDQVAVPAGTVVPKPAQAPAPSAVATAIPAPKTEPAASASRPAQPLSPAELLEEQGALLGAITALIEPDNLEQSFHALANRVAQRFRCLRVYVGSTEGRRVVMRAVSGMVDFDPRSALMIDVEQAMSETQVLGSVVSVPDPVQDHVPPRSHASLAEQLNNPALLSVPLVANDRVAGVVLLERDRPFSAREAQQLERLSLLLSPMLALKTVDAMSAPQWLRRFCGRALKSVFGPRRVGLKLSLLLLAVLVVSSACVTRMFRVDADAAIEASVQRAVVSGFPSFLRQVEARAGDLVQQGDVLALLDVEELQLERIEWTGEKDKLVKEYRANLAQRDRSKVRVLEAQRAQAQAKIDLIDAQIDRAVLRAPIDGVVISGDLLQALGKPVERGELLFEVASLQDYRLVLNLDETDIGWVRQGSRGRLRLRSLTDRTFPFEVTSITPVSEPGQGANVFRVEASLDGLPENLRPGMAGVAKIEVEPRSVGWIWTRSFVSWLRMQLWKLGAL